jgi:N-methylhydantoinase A
VTDANVVLGRINPDRPIGGKLKRLDVDAARGAIDAHVAKPLRLDLMAAAEAIVRVANSRMAGAIRLVSIERGHDPKRFALMPFGGAGALHAGALMKEVGLASTLVPRYPGVTSALGCVIADMRHDFVQTINRPLDALDIAGLNAAIGEMTGNGRALLERAGIKLGGHEASVELDMSYIGQTHTVSVPVDIARGALTVRSIRDAFDTAYRGAFGRLLDGIPVRVLTLRAAVIGRRSKLDLAILAPGAGSTTPTGERSVWFDGKAHATRIYDRLALPVGTEIPGPAILEQPDATTWIDPDLTGRVDRFGNLNLTRKP